jgi:hypothetical protein
VLRFFALTIFHIGLVSGAVQYIGKRVIAKQLSRLPNSLDLNPEAVFRNLARFASLSASQRHESLKQAIICRKQQESPGDDAITPTAGAHFIHVSGGFECGRPVSKSTVTMR